MKKSFVLFFAIMVSVFLVSCSGDSSTTADATKEAPTTETAAAPDKTKTAPLTDEVVKDRAYQKITNGLKNRGIKLSADQETALKQLISEIGITAENAKAKRKELVSMLRADILTEDQKAKIGK
ncbi:hypothetical protein [Phaeodactylibacter xiamenensis]|jgi:uncharacterized membrane protein|uniref:hypothetical protein n=1 Tax=Phaeodactylibacter xiamenensis TaxID=1524460 RepID=UPI0024A85D6C|nr:hypothetical protein [Phaeodactylibacter xiamenensis]